VAATFHDGVISRITDFRQSPSAPPGELQFVQYTMATWGGFSGSPVFLPNGRVVAIHNMASTIPNKKTGEVRAIPHGIRVDSLWELLVYHKLDDKIAAKIDPRQVLLERWLKPDEKSEKIRQDYAQAVALVSDASHLVFVKQDYGLGVDKCTEAIKLMPNYARAYFIRANGFVNNWFDNRRRMARNDAWSLLDLARKDATKYIQLAPSDPDGVVLLCVVLNNTGQFSKDYSHNRKALEILNELLQSQNLTLYKRAEAHSLRAVAYDNLGDKRTAMQEHNEAIRLAPDYYILYENRADFWHYRGRRDLERADLAKSRELRQKQ
jgi:tetratricopeptide (TPR) repeat protein